MTATAIDWAAAGISEARVNGPEEPLDWDAIDWRAEEEQVRRLRQRIFKATQAGDWKQARNLQLCRIRHSCSYSDTGIMPNPGVSSPSYGEMSAADSA
jgi:hypothetical protein